MVLAGSLVIGEIHYSVAMSAHFSEVSTSSNMTLDVSFSNNVW